MELVISVLALRARAGIRGQQAIVAGLAPLEEFGLRKKRPRIEFPPAHLGLLGFFADCGICPTSSARSTPESSLTGTDSPSNKQSIKMSTQIPASSAALGAFMAEIWPLRKHAEPSC
jgi:hypothetical protein